jgi:hypothetical protein
VGGLTPEITVDELKERFQRFCEVLDVQIKKKRNCESMTAKILTIGFVYRALDLFIFLVVLGVQIKKL